MISWYIASRSDIKVALRVLQRVDERVDLLGRGVEVRRRPRAGLNAVPQVCGLRAVVPSAYGDTAAVQDLADVVRMQAGQLEAHRSPALVGGCGAEHAHTAHRR